MPDFWDYENLGSGEQAFDDYFLRQSDNQFKIPSPIIKDTLFIEFEVSNVTCDNVPRVQYKSAPQHTNAFIMENVTGNTKTEKSKLSRIKY